MLAFLIGYAARKYIAEARIASAEEAARRIVEEAEREAEARKREASLESKEEAHRMRQELERENRERRSELQRLESRLVQREETLDRKLESIEKKEELLDKKTKSAQAIKEQLESTYQEQLRELERISGLTSEEARTLLLTNVENEIRHEVAMLIKNIETEANEEADKRARDIITQAIQRCAADHVAEATVSVVTLPNDEMTGRIIGREGRNIRALETMTGVDL